MPEKSWGGRGKAPEDPRRFGLGTKADVQKFFEQFPPLTKDR